MGEPVTYQSQPGSLPPRSRGEKRRSLAGTLAAAFTVFSVYFWVTSVLGDKVTALGALTVALIGGFVVITLFGEKKEPNISPMARAAMLHGHRPFLDAPGHLASVPEHQMHRGWLPLIFCLITLTVPLAIRLAERRDPPEPPTATARSIQEPDVSTSMTIGVVPAALEQR
jgi:hypothetical protein